MLWFRPRRGWCKSPYIRTPYRRFYCGRGKWFKGRGFRFRRHMYPFWSQQMFIEPNNGSIINDKGSP